MDPYLFDNFETVDGDFLAAKFKAFKFPESNYVQFKGTVSVCIDKCKGVSVTHDDNKNNTFHIQFCDGGAYAVLSSGIAKRSKRVSGNVASRVFAVMTARN